MFKCVSCGKEYEFEQCFALVSNDPSDDVQVFDGKKMRSVCPMCGGMIHRVEDETAAEMPLAAVV